MNPRRVCSALAAIAAGVVGLWLLGPGSGVREETSPGTVQQAAKPASPLPSTPTSTPTPAPAPALARKRPSLPGPSPRSGPRLLPPGDRQLGGGRFLVASRTLSGPFFAESIVLVLDYSAQGAVGLVVNRPTDAALGELIPEFARLSRRRDRVYRGGPVDPSVMTFLIRSEQAVAGGIPVAPGVYATPNAEALGSVIQSGTPTSHFRAFVGYSGWGPGQLDREVARGDWHLGTARAEAIFDDAPGDLWQRIVVEFEGIQVRRGSGAGQNLALRSRPPKDDRAL